MWVDFGLHSSELAHAQTAPAFLPRRVGGIRRDAVHPQQRHNVLVPNMNPDGTTRWADWYEHRAAVQHRRRLACRCVGRDNGHDWFMFTQPESRNIAHQLYAEWFPQVIHNQHQSAPFPARIFIPPFEDPMNPNIPALVMRGINTVGDAMGRRFAQEGKPGAISRVQFDAWWNGGMRTAPYFHNMVGILTETGHPWPWPVDYDASTFPRTFNNGVATLEPSTYYPSPFRAAWHFRNSCGAHDDARWPCSTSAPGGREEWLYDIYQMGRDAIRAGASETYIVPADQWDPGTAVKMINTPRIGGVEVERATAPFTVNGKTYGAGSFLIRGAQPFRPYVTDLLNPQVYPASGSTPEDRRNARRHHGWTLPMQMGVTVDQFDVAVQATAEPVRRPACGGAHRGSPRRHAFDPQANDSFTAVNRCSRPAIM
jgi:hypothetical protein